MQPEPAQVGERSARGQPEDEPHVVPRPVAPEAEQGEPEGGREGERLPVQRVAGRRPVHRATLVRDRVAPLAGPGSLARAAVRAVVARRARAADRSPPVRPGWHSPAEGEPGPGAAARGPGGFDQVETTSIARVPGLPSSPGPGRHRPAVAASLPARTGARTPRPARVRHTEVPGRPLSPPTRPARCRPSARRRASRAARGAPRRSGSAGRAPAPTP